MDDVVANTTDHLPQDISDIDWTAVQLTNWRVYRHSQRRGVSGINRSHGCTTHEGDMLMGYTKDQMIKEMDSIDGREEDRKIDEARLNYQPESIEPGVAKLLGAEVISYEEVTYDPKVSTSRPSSSASRRWSNGSKISPQTGTR